MLWSLLRTATRKGFSSNALYRPQSSRLCKISSVRFDGISGHFWHGTQQRIICSRCYKGLDIAKGSPSYRASLLPFVNRRFVGTRAGSKGYSASNMRNRTTAVYTIALAVTIVGLSYLAVPLYRLFCQVSDLLFIVGQASFLNSLLSQTYIDYEPPPHVGWEGEVRNRIYVIFKKFQSSLVLSLKNFGF